MDVSFLEPVLSAPGPFATVCADVSHTTENAATELDLRVRAITEDLEKQGTPEPVLAAVRDRLLEGNQGGEAGTLRGRALVVAGDGRVVFDEALAATPRRELVEWSPEPDLVPVLRQLPGRIPHVVALVDRTGADVTVAGVPGRPDEVDSVEGDTFRIRKLKVGAWAQDHWQNAVEEQWAENARRVADDISSHVRRHGVRFVLVAGDVRARQQLLDKAADAWKDLVVTTDEGGRAAGADREPVDRRAEELVAEYEAADDAKVLEQIEAASAHGLALTGTALVVEALRKGQVETLVLADPPDDEQLRVGSSPLELGRTEDELAALGARESRPVPADRALVAAAVAVSARVVVLPRAAMPGDIPVAAILRHTDESTPSAQRREA